MIKYEGNIYVSKFILLKNCNIFQKDKSAIVYSPSKGDPVNHKAKIYWQKISGCSLFYLCLDWIYKGNLQQKLYYYLNPILLLILLFVI